MVAVWYQTFSRYICPVANKQTSGDNAHPEKSQVATIISHSASVGRLVVRRTFNRFFGTGSSRRQNLFQTKRLSINISAL
jgi:hypothetical protein